MTVEFPDWAIDGYWDTVPGPDTSWWFQPEPPIGCQ